MLSFLGSAVPVRGMVLLDGVNLEAVFMYGLVALVVGLIAWSKYKEPPLSDPYAKAGSGRHLPATAGELGPAVAVPVVRTPVASREQP
jgi:hypothetical protein